jgi:SprT protein
MQEKILNKVEESFLKAEKYYNRTFPRPRIIFKRSGTTAGYAKRNCSELMFQLDLAEHHEKDFIDNTVPHEVAHCIQFHLYPKSQGHGYEWKFIMSRVMGILCQHVVIPMTLP